MIGVGDRRHLLLHLDAPLMAFGAPIVDQHGVTGDVPLPSMVAGLLGNALGYRRTDAHLLQRLQDRLVLAARWDRPGERLRDFQTAELGASDRAWTTRGRPEGRAGGAGTYLGKHIRHRWHQADARVTIALRLDPEAGAPTIDDLAAALSTPARPLFIGRKPCLPAGPLFVGFAVASTTLEAVIKAPLVEGEPTDRNLRIFWPEGEGEVPHSRRLHIQGRRDWRSGVHGGNEVWHETEMPLPAEAPP
jgi:CRISPR system Cascade subunit CasD